jgi:hypothetical protein
MKIEKIIKSMKRENNSLLAKKPKHTFFLGLEKIRTRMQYQ